MNRIIDLIKEKELCRNNLKKPEIIKAFYDKLRKLSLKELKNLFPVPSEMLAQTIFDCTNEIIAEPSLDSAIKASVVLFQPESFEKCSQSPYQKDMCLLQAMFFFLIKDIASNEENKNLFESALNDGSWRYSEKQAELLNKLACNMNFSSRDFFEKIDFNALGHKHYNGNESVLRLFYNFMHPSLYAREGIINELNFVREQQNIILPVIPNTKKTNFTSSAANKEIENKNKNLDVLKKLDFGFYDEEYTQSFFACDETYKEPFVRPIYCKCFPESELEWEEKPIYKRHNNQRKIAAIKSIRAANRRQLTTKFLYSERNMITHMGENAAIYRLLVKEYNGKEKKFWYELMLESMYDIHEYLVKFNQKAEGKKLLNIINHYFSKMTDKINLQNVPVEKRWHKVFDKQGLVKINSELLSKTNVFNILSDAELTHFKRFLGLIYCSENDENDFLERNRIRIQLYLIYISLELSKKDK